MYTLSVRCSYGRSDTVVVEFEFNVLSVFWFGVKVLVSGVILTEIQPPTSVARVNFAE